MGANSSIGNHRGESVHPYLCATSTCGLYIFLPKSQLDKLYESGDSFYCTAGHRQAWDGQAKVDAKERQIREAEERATHAERRACEAAEAQEAATKARRKAERTCTWPTCGAVLRSPRMLRQHMVDVHGAPWATPEVSAEEIGQVLKGRDQVEVVQ